MPRKPTGRARGRPPGSGVFDDHELLDRALRAMARGGYRALSMRSLARELGVSLASVQHRFRTKDELWRAAVDSVLATEVGDLPGRERLPEVLQRRIATSVAYPGLLFAVVTDDAPGHEQRLAYVVSRLRPKVEATRRALADADDAGTIRAIDVEVLVAVMMVGASALGALPVEITDMLGLGREPHERLARGFADLILHGVAVH